MDGFKRAALAATVSRVAVSADRNFGDGYLAGSRISGCCTASHPSDHSVSCRPEWGTGHRLTRRPRPEATSPPLVTVRRHRCRPWETTSTLVHRAPRSADPCWASTPGSLLCVDNPWDKRLHRVTYGGPLPHVQPGAIADPFALVLMTARAVGFATAERGVDGMTVTSACTAAWSRRLKPCGPVVCPARAPVPVSIARRRR